jgi:uncharacterized protein YkwD
MNMSKKAFSIIVLLGIVLSACGGQAAQATETSTAVPETATEVPATNTAVEETIPVTGDEATATAIPSPTATVFVPENAADCTNLASFISDVTIPDNSTVNAGASFTKTWRVQNAGTCIWWAGYTLTHYSENAMSAPDTVPLPVTNPGETADISVDLIAPSVAGTYRGNFVIENPEGLIMQVDEDSRLWLIINVTGSATSAPTGTPGASSSSSGASGTAAPTSASSNTGSGGATCAFTTDAGRTNAVVTAINAYRAQNGLAAQPVNARLSQAAQAHANDMACNNLFVHTGSDGSTPETRVAAAGYSASDVSENVYGSYPPLTGEGAVNWWAADQTDPRHNENLLTTKYIEIGVGYAFFDNFGYYVVVFATP